MLNKNSLLMIERIIINEILSVPQLIQELSFTKRQIEYQLESINDLLVDSYGLPKNRLLQVNEPVQPETLELLKEIFLNQAEHYNFNHEERQFYIFLAILCNKDYLTLYHLTDELEVSKTTIQADLKELKQKLEILGIHIRSERMWGYTLNGSTPLIQNFLIKGINSVHKTVIKHFLKKRSLDFTGRYLISIRRISNVFGLSLVENRFEEFAYLLAILSISNLAFRGLPDSPPSVISDKIVLLKEYRFAETLLKELKLNWGSDKTEYISAWLIGISVSDIENDTPDKPYLSELLRQILLRFQALSGLQYLDFDSALAQLYAHFRPAFYRNIYGLPISNPLTGQILEQYRTTAILVRETIKPLNYILNVPFSEDELAYLTVHFASFTTQKSLYNPYRKQAAIVCNAGMGFSALLKKQLENLFPEFDFSITTYNALKKDLKVPPYHAVFSTSLGYQSGVDNVPVFYVPSILNNQDKYLLSQKVYKTFGSFNEFLPSVHDLISIIHKHARITSESKLRGDLMNYFSQPASRENLPSPLLLADMVSPMLIQTAVSAPTAREAVNLSAMPLLHNNYITRSYVAAVLDTFNSSSHHTVIMKSVALPHASPQKGVLKPGISITVLKTPIPFNVAEYDPIKYIFCLSAVDYESHISAMAKLVEFLEDDRFYKVLDSQNASDIFNYMMVYGAE